MFNFNRTVKSVGAVLLAVLLTLNTTSYVQADYSGNLTFFTSFNDQVTSSAPNETVVLKLTYGYGSATYQDVAPVLQVNVPNDMEIISGTSITINDSNYNNVTVTPVISGDKSQITYNMLANKGDGYTGFVEVSLRFKKGTTTNDADGSITSTFTSTGSVVEEDIVYNVLASDVPESEITISKSKTLPAGDPVPGSDVTYRITVEGNDSDGMNYASSTVVDTYEAGAVVIDADGGTVDTSAHTITWQEAGPLAGSNLTYDVVLNYPEGTFSAPTSVDNEVSVTGTDIEGNILSDTDTATHNLVAPSYSIGNVTKSSRTGSDRYSVGQTLQFYIKNISNGSNVPLSGYIVTDDIPDGMDVTLIKTGNYYNDSGVLIDVEYQVNGVDVWLSDSDWANQPATSNNTLVVSDLSMAGDEDITAIRLVYSDLPVGFSLYGGNSNAIQVQGTLRNQYFDDTTNVNTGDTLTNNVTVEAPNVTTDSALVIVTVSDPVPKLSVAKSVDDSTLSEASADTATYTIRITNSGYATGPLDLSSESIVIEDTLPMTSLGDPVYDSFSFDQGSLESAGGNPGTITYNGVSDQTHSWTISDTVLQPGESVYFKYSVNVINGTLVGNYTNEAVIIPDSDIEVDDRTNASDYDDTAKVYVSLSGTMASTKYIKGEFDDDYKDGLNSSTIGGGPANFRLEVDNSGTNAPVNNIVLIDKLPSYDDTAVLNSSEARLSQWEPYLVDDSFTYYVQPTTGPSVVISASDVTVYYTTDSVDSATYNEALADPLNFDPTGFAGNQGSWQLWSSATAPEDLTAVTALAFAFDSDIQLYPNEKLRVEFDMRAPVGAPAGIDAWNSFAFNATYPGSGSGYSPFAANEPNKVGVSITAVPDANIYSLGDFIWLDSNYNGVQDSNETGLNNILVNLYEDVDGNGVLSSDERDNHLVAYTRTGTSYQGDEGYYLFPHLPAGDYIIGYTMPTTASGAESYYATIPNAGTDQSVDSNFTAYGSGNLYVTGAIALNDSTADTNGAILSIDAGLYKKASVGNLVWLDEDADGIQDNGESGISGINVTLHYASDDTIAASDTTDGSGYYLFEDVNPGTYYVQFNDLRTVRPYVVSKANATSDSKDSDGVQGEQTQTRTPDFTMASDEVNLTFDLGLYEYAEVGDLVWIDTDRDGAQDVEETTGVENVTVTLIQNGVDVAVTTTSDLGMYLFEELVPGNYTIKFDLPVGYSSSPVGSTADDVDSDGIPDSYDVDDHTITDGFTLISGDSDLTRDQGVYQSFSIGDYIWLDANGNGQQNVDESGLNGIGISLYSGNTLLSTTTTSFNGHDGWYTFDDLSMGTYKIAVTLPDGYLLTHQDEADTDDVDSDADRATAMTGTYTFDASTLDRHNPTVDVGLFQPGSIGDYIWIDKDYDGVQEDDEVGLSGVSVGLKDSDGNLVQVDGESYVETDHNGYYHFGDLFPDTYSIYAILPETYHLTKLNSGADDAKDSDAVVDPSDDDQVVVSTIVIDNGEDETTIDIGLYQYGSIGDYVWLDADFDGKQDDDESGVENIKVILFDSNDNEIAQTSTDDQGHYLFENVTPGEYYVTFSDLRTSKAYIVTTQNQGDDATDSDGEAGILESTKTHDTTLESGGADLTLDLGLFEYASVGDKVWEDVNRNGLQDVGEAGIAEVVVRLVQNDVTVSEVLTDVNGIYQFEQLLPGTYRLDFEVPAGYTVTRVSQGADVSLDSDGTPDQAYFDEGASTSDFVLASGEDNTTLDLGLYKSFGIGDYVWVDTNGDGIQDAEESGLDGVTMMLYQVNDDVNPIASQVTYTKDDQKGYYFFDDLPMGGYYVKAVPTAAYKVTAQGAGDESVDSDFDQSTLLTKDYVFNSNTDLSDRIIETVDLGLYRLAGLGDYVWEDLNYNGIQDEGEPGIAGVQVTLNDGEGNPVLVDGETYLLTDEYGYYFFEDLIPDTYTLVFELPEDYLLTIMDVGDDSEDSDGITGDDVGTASITAVVINENDTNDTLDLGLYRKGSIGDYFWYDTNKNGLQNESETPVVGEEVILTGSDGSVKTTVTDDTGYYLFDELDPDTYAVSFNAPSGYRFTASDQEDSEIGANDDSKDSDSDYKGEVTEVVLISGEVNNSIDAGVYKRRSKAPEVEVVETPTPEEPEDTEETPPVQEETEDKDEDDDVVYVKEDTPEDDQEEEIVYTPITEVGEVTVKEQPEKGTVEIKDDGSIVYTPGPDFDGRDQVVLTITTPEGDMEEIIIEIIDAIPEAGLLPETGGLPSNVFVGIGTLLIAFGTRLKKKS